MPEITLSLPAALGFLALFLTVGAVLVFFVLRGSPKAAAAVIPPTAVTTPTPPTATITLTPTITLTSTITLSPTLQPTLTPLPTISYTVANGDLCSGLAATFKISVQAIILANNLPASCTLYVGQKLNIPQPTPTASPQPTATMSSAEATDAACQKYDVTVQAGDTLSKIAANFNVSATAIKNYNGLVNDTVFEGQTLKIPLCERAPTPGPTPTVTPPPPYPAPNLLLPADGAAFTLSNDSITLQWASVGSLRPNEAYAVLIEDVTDATGRKLIEYVTDTKFIVPATFRPADTLPHIMRWWILPVRQTGTDNAGKPFYEPGGAASVQRVFSWSGVAGAASPTPGQ